MTLRKHLFEVIFPLGSSLHRLLRKILGPLANNYSFIFPPKSQWIQQNFCVDAKKVNQNSQSEANQQNCGRLDTKIMS